jgi:polyphosphate kinase 2 (PPK2 family)
MFQEAEADPQLSQDEFKKIEQHLRILLVNEQYRHIALKDRALLILVAGIDGAGKGETINLLNEWMDPRHIHTHAFGPMTQEERERPEMWRFWRALPPKGRIGVFFGAWQTMPILERVLGRLGPGGFAALCDALAHCAALRALAVTVGLRGAECTEVSGDGLSEGLEVVLGVERAAAASGGNPLAPGAGRSAGGPRR